MHYRCMYSCRCKNIQKEKVYLLKLPEEEERLKRRQSHWNPRVQVDTQNIVLQTQHQHSLDQRFHR